tara:strand:+ start:9533 stop:10150 length:618 start_codon:yes stop_codon:yes gene_type:complete
MKIEVNQAILTFAETLSGVYSNKLQSQNKPKEFAHINIYFRPIEWSVLNAPGLYSEQSYNYSPWSPYRQAIHKICISKGVFRVQNYMLKNKERIAGAGIDKTLLKELTKGNLVERVGCRMDFRLINKDYYTGNIEKGNKCIISREGRLSYLASKVELRENSFISEESGFDKKTNKKIWGSADGPFIFKKTISYREEVNKRWVNLL